MFDFAKSETLKPADLQPLDPTETSTYKFVNNVIAKRAKAIDDAVCAVIRDIATEQGIDTEIILYEENIVKAIANYTFLQYKHYEHHNYHLYIRGQTMQSQTLYFRPSRMATCFVRMLS